MTRRSRLSSPPRRKSTPPGLTSDLPRIGWATQSFVADGPGVVTSVGAEPGEVVRAGQMVAQVARDGGLDAVFDAPEQLVRTGPRDPAVEIALSDDPRIKAAGRIREVAPQADSATRTFQVKVGIIGPPEAMRLGSTVTGRIRLAAPDGVEVPATALSQSNGRPAVWVVDRRSQTVSLRIVDVERYEAASALIAQGLDTGDVVVTAGVQILRPDQKVRAFGRLPMTRFNLSEWAIRHRALVAYFMLMIVVAGVASYFRLGRSEESGLHGQDDGGHRHLAGRDRGGHAPAGDRPAGAQAPGNAEP